MRKLLQHAHNLHRVPARAAREAFTDLGFVSRYFAMGAASTVINFGAFWILYEMLAVWYILSAALAFLIRVGFKFHSMRTWLFGIRVEGAVRSHLLQFFTLELGYLVGSILLLAGLVELAGLAPFIALIIASAVTSASALVLTRAIFRPEMPEKGI